MLRELNLEGLSHFADGTVDASFARHVKRAILDCEDRPGEKKARTITLVVNIVPVVLQEGAVIDTNVDCTVKSSVPDHISKTVECRLKQGGRALFNDMSADHVDQRTIDEMTGGD